ncbi:MAG: winged helix DNA-binding domain-containing protein, partial [Polyangiaceae bacterium]
MTFDLVRERARRHFAREPRPEDVVRKLVAVQAQDYLGSLWALGLRTKSTTESSIERAIAEKKIVRTWPLRNTLHFVAAEDLRWILELAGPAAIARARTRHGQLGLDEAAFTKSRRLFERALAGGKLLSRKEMYETLSAGKISPEGQRGIHVLGRLAQENVICFGPRRKKEQTFALSDDWLPKTKKRARGDALGELARRYFEGHGPATLDDFRWWSGLTARDAREAVHLVESELERETVRDRIYYSSPSSRGRSQNGSSTH